MTKYELWEETGYGNYVKRVGAMFVSYNPSIRNNIFDAFLVETAGADDRREKDETALRLGPEWYILNGDFREEYNECYTAKECLEVYDKFKEEFDSDFSVNNGGYGL